MAFGYQDALHFYYAHFSADDGNHAVHNGLFQVDGGSAFASPARAPSMRPATSTTSASPARPAPNVAKHGVITVCGTTAC